MSAVEIRRELWMALYVQRWEGKQMFAIKSKVVGRPYVFSDNPVESADQNFKKFQIL
jgi:hypothetical protein